MSYSLSLSDPSLEAGIRRIALVQIDAALDEIDSTLLDPAETVHQVRKRCKKLRGLIRLVRPAFSDYTHENAAIRDTARTLSGIRDATSVIEAFDRVVAAFEFEANDKRFAPIRERLVAARSGLDRGATDRKLASMAATLRAVRQRAESWSLSSDGAHGFAAGVEKTYRQGQAALNGAISTGSDEMLHEWRKPVKNHGYQARLLKGIWPEMMLPYAQLVSDLGDTLGDHHDLAVFGGHIDSGGIDLTTRDRKRLRKLLSERQAQLEADAIATGRRLYAEPPEAVAARWSAWWEIWREAV